MALIRDYKIRMKSVKETQYTPEGEEPELCKVCGEPIYGYKSEKYGSWKDSCFGSKCIKPYNIGMIRGDIHSFSVKEYDIPGHPDISYPKADGYSAELRGHIKAFLEAWGFENITFKEPGENSNDRHTIIRGTHRSTDVNIAYKSALKTDRILCFNNKYGVVVLTKQHRSEHEANHWRKWGNIISAIEGSLKRRGIKPYYIGNMDKVIVLPNREQLRTESEKGILQAKKDNMLSDIWSHSYKIKEYKGKIKREQEDIDKLKAKYLETFGEIVPQEKANC